MINDQSEVYYKGEGVTEDDARKLGDFLLSQGYFNTVDQRSVQLSREKDSYVVKMVVDEEKVNTDETVLTGFKVWQMWIEESVFNGKQTKIVLANTELKTIKEVGEFSDQEKSELNTGSPQETDSGVNTDQMIRPK